MSRQGWQIVGLAVFSVGVGTSVYVQYQVDAALTARVAAATEVANLPHEAAAKLAVQVAATAKEAEQAQSDSIRLAGEGAHNLPIRDLS